MASDRSSFTIAGVVLAAGSSRRFGADKRLLPIAGEPMIRRVVRRALEAGLDPVLVVVAPDHERVGVALAGLPCAMVVNPEPARGARSSLREGFAAVPSSCSGAVVMLGDMPMVGSEMVAEVAAALVAGRRLVLSRYGGVVAPPNGFARALFAELGGEGDDAGRRLVDAHRGEAVHLDWPADRLLDVDEPSDGDLVIG